MSIVLRLLRVLTKYIKYAAYGLSILAFVEVLHFPDLKFQLWLFSAVMLLVAVICQRLHRSRSPTKHLAVVMGRNVRQLYQVPENQVPRKKFSHLPTVQQISIFCFVLFAVNSYWQVVRTGIPISRGGSADGWYDAALICGVVLMLQFGILDTFVRRQSAQFPPDHN